jgi:hypothetical protein
MHAFERLSGVGGGLLPAPKLVRARACTTLGSMNPDIPPIYVENSKICKHREVNT